jgi:integrase
MGRKPSQVEGIYERKEGSGFWYARFRVGGKLTRKSFGRDRAKAVAYVEKSRTGRRSGDRAAIPTATVADSVADELASGVLLDELCTGLLNHIQSRPNVYKDQLNPPCRIERIRKAFGHRQAASLKPYEISDWLEALGTKPATMNRYKAMFSAVYRYGKERDKVQVNPVRDVKQQRVNNTMIRYLLPKEETRLRSVLNSHIAACGPQNERLKKHLIHRVCELDVALGTGMRKGEQYNLRWSDVDFTRRVIVLKDTKNGTSRTIPMIDDVIAAMRVLKQMPLVRKPRSMDRPNNTPQDAVFSVGDNKKWWYATLEEAKIKDLRWHDLRHTFCSRLAQSGASLKLIQEAAGHKTIQMAARYSHMDQTTLHNAMAVLNRKKGTA